MTAPEDIDPEGLLRGEYDAERFPEGFSREHPMPPAETHVVSREGLLHRPFLDERYRPTEDFRWPGDKEFAVCLTHDVDHISAISPVHEMRKGLLRARERFRARARPGPTLPKSGVLEATKGLAGGALRASKAALARGRDPYHRWEDWMEVEDEVGARSTFFVLPEKTRETHVTDAEYRYDDEVEFEGRSRPLSEVLSEVGDRGWEVGLHSSWYSYDDVEEMMYQRRQVEEAAGTDVVSVRQHWLHHDVRRTPRVQQEAGLKFDSTLGPKGDVGFRFGTSFPWRLHDLEADEELDLVEVPLVIQDTALFDDKYGGMDEQEAFETVKKLTERLREVGGVLTLNWHNNADERRWRVYERVLGYLSELDPWFGTVEEIGEYWDEEVG